MSDYFPFPTVQSLQQYFCGVTAPEAARHVRRKNKQVIVIDLTSVEAELSTQCFGIATRGAQYDGRSQGKPPRVNGSAKTET